MTGATLSATERTRIFRSADRLNEAVANALTAATLFVDIAKRHSRHNAELDQAAKIVLTEIAKCAEALREFRLNAQLS